MAASLNNGCVAVTLEEVREELLLLGQQSRMLMSEK